ncbi:MAG: hypothetical protein R3237_00075 [Nitrosopumilaceae archaeon]|nr:hypothetical protein [Nitrosopumilaceae archaeon]
MIIKITIIGALVIAGGILFGSEIKEFFPQSTSTGVDSLKSDVKTLATHTIQTAEKTIESSVETAETKLTEIKQNSTDFVEEKIVSNIPFIKENPQ